ncbi:MAG: DUF4338 domain-containing protein [Bryobacteraceae bacterium]
MELIRQITADFRQLALTELAHTVCELLEWKRPNGKLKSRECYSFLQTLQGQGELPWLPAPRAKARGGHQTRLNVASDPQQRCEGALRQWLPVSLELVDTASDRKLFEQYIERYHYLGYRVPFGAQLRYLMRSGQQNQPVLGCLLYTSGAWKMAPRDSYIGWSQPARVRNLPRVINNSRFLILPWVRIANLASHVLSMASKRLVEDWRAWYGVEPVLMETLVDRSRYAGTCYRAANWISVGMTQGRGRMDRSRQAEGPEKEIFLHPLRRGWQSQLCDTERSLSLDDHRQAQHDQEQARQRQEEE